MTQRTVPTWALQRVSTAVSARGDHGPRNINPAEVARRTGLNKSLVRQCLYLLKSQ
jgi:hypothetical protein